MKTKIKILIVSCVIAAAAVTGFNMAQENSNMDVSLADIAVMARADGESGGGLECDCVDCPSSEFGCWSYDYSYKDEVPGNEGYEGSWQCEGPGRIEQNVITRNGPC